MFNYLSSVFTSVCNSCLQMVRQHQSISRSLFNFLINGGSDQLVFFAGTIPCFSMHLLSTTEFISIVKMYHIPIDTFVGSALQIFSLADVTNYHNKVK